MEAPTLISPDYSKEFHIFSSASDDTLAAVLLQADEEYSEHPVAFFSKTLRDVELRYDIIENQAYALIKSLKAFRIYILHSKGLARLMAEENFRMLDMNLMSINSEDGQTEEETVEPGQNQSLAENVVSCEWCQRFEGEQQLKSLPLKPTHASGPFQRWGLDFIGEINPHSSGQHRWILAATDYFTKWIEAIPTREADHHVVMRFLTENIFTSFGCPYKLVTDNAAAFRAKELVDMCDSMGIKLVHSTSYYPQGNGLAESSNKSLIRIIKKLLEDNKKNWDSKLKYALWADRVTTKKSTENSPFKLVYGTEVVFPIQLTLPMTKFLQEEHNEEEDMAKRITDLAEVHQIIEQLVEKSAANQKRIKEAFDRKAKADNFQVGDLVLKWDTLKEKKGNHGKLDALWTGPFVITQI
eukprot:PITA_33529